MKVLGRYRVVKEREKCGQALGTPPLRAREEGEPEMMLTRGDRRDGTETRAAVAGDSVSGRTGLSWPHAAGRLPELSTKKGAQ